MYISVILVSFPMFASSQTSGGPLSWSVLNRPYLAYLCFNLGNVRILQNVFKPKSKMMRMSFVKFWRVSDMDEQI